MWIYIRSGCIINESIHDQRRRTLLTFDVCAWANAIANEIHWPCAHSFPLLSCLFAFPVLEEDILLMVRLNPRAIHLKYITVTVFASYPARLPIQTSRCNI